MKSPIRSVLALAATCLAVPALSQTSAREYTLDIKRQSLSDALIEFSQQTDLQVAYLVEEPRKDILVGPLDGRFTADAAIAQLFLRNGFSFERLNERTIVIAGPESTREHGALLSTEQKMDTSLLSSFMRLANLRWAEGAATKDNFQQKRTADSVQESDRKKSSTLEEIVVTAQRREEKLQDVPISISVLTGEDLDHSTVPDISEALRNVPGIVLHETSYGGLTQVPIRGVAAQSPAVSDGGAAPTAYYLDSVPFGFVRSAFAPAPDAYDLERVEVLRGPQGTLYGANALNGVVRVLVKDANLDSFEFKTRALTSSTENGGWNYRGDMAANVPIVEGKLAARAVLGYQDLSGWIDRVNNKDANDLERRNMRLKISAQPTEALSIGLSAWASRSDSGSHSGADDNGRNSAIYDEPISTDYDAYGLKIGYEFPRLSVTSVTSYIDFANDLELGGSDFEGSRAYLVETYAAETFAQELAINSTPGGSWRWSAGAMYRDSKDVDDADLLPFSTTPIILRQHSESYAVFGELTRLFMSGQLEFTAGLRYFEDDVTQSEGSRWSFGEPFDPNDLTTVDGTFHATTPRLVLTWHPSEQMTAYASYSEGFRSGFHQFPNVIENAPPTKPDHLTNYELGSKGSLLGGRLAFDAALYYIDWQDIQQGRLVPVGGVCCLGIGLNGESASGVGFDLGMTARPVDSLQLGASFSWNDLAFDEDVVDNGLVLFEKGDRPNNSAEYTLGASADYIFPIGGFEGRFSVAANYTSEIPVRDILESSAGGPLLMGRTSLSLAAPDHWTASLFVDNINNEQDPAQKTPANRPNRWVRVRPRTIGLQLEYRY